MKLPTIILVLACGSGGLSAQIQSDNSGSGSVTYFSESKTTAPGGSATSATYSAVGTIGEQGPATATSSAYTVAGGFGSTIDAVSTGPWLAAAEPLFIGPKSTRLVWLNGTRLNLGGKPTVTVSGSAATVFAFDGTHVAINLPALPEPGWHEIELSNFVGKSSLERGLGVLPMIYTEGVAASEKAYHLVFKGSKGDVVLWVLGFNPFPSAIPVANFLHGLTIDPSLLRFLPSFQIFADNGEFRMSIPPVPFPTYTLYAQALFVTTNPTYTPGSFSNRLKF